MTLPLLARQLSHSKMGDGNWVGDWLAHIRQKPSCVRVSYLGVREPQRSKMYHFTQPFPHTAPQPASATGLVLFWF